MRAWILGLGACGRVAIAAIVIAISSLTLGAQTRRFFSDDPIWREPMTQDV
jgi:hypothetical protein